MIEIGRQEPELAPRRPARAVVRHDDIECGDAILGEMGTDGSGHSTIAGQDVEHDHTRKGPFPLWTIILRVDGIVLFVLALQSRRERQARQMNVSPRQIVSGLEPIFERSRLQAVASGIRA